MNRVYFYFHFHFHFHFPFFKKLFSKGGIGFLDLVNLSLGKG